MFCMLAYTDQTLNSAAFVALTGVPDPEFTLNANNQFQFSELYSQIACFGRGATLADLRFNIPTINQYARHHPYTLNQSATVPSNPIVHETFDMPIDLPKYEQIAFEALNSAGGAEKTDVFQWLVPTGNWNRNLPAGAQRLTIEATATAGGAAGVWNGPAILTFAENLKSGWYEVVGAQAVRAGNSAFRLIFANPWTNNGRKMRPGGLCTQAIGNFPWWQQMGKLGSWGRFHTFEPPQVEVYQTTGASVSMTLWLDCIFTGQGPPM